MTLRFHLIRGRSSHKPLNVQMGSWFRELNLRGTKEQSLSQSPDLQSRAPHSTMANGVEETEGGLLKKKHLSCLHLNTKKTAPGECKLKT